MNSYSRFKVNALIQMARTTEISSQRERYITLAEEELNKNGVLEFDSVEQFISVFIKNDRKKRVERGKLYERYLDFCQNNEYSPSTKNVLYRVMREYGFGECKVNGIDCFRCTLVGAE